MPLKIHNTLTRELELFTPMRAMRANMYVCGITPYDEPHLGHARAYITFDVVRRYLEYLGYKVNYIQNITDVDDKIIKKAADEGGSITDVAEKYTREYFRMMEALNVRPADMYPKATEHISDMIATIEALIKKGLAYVADGDVYFEVKKFNGYGKLSGRDEKAMMAGARVAVDARKKSPLDFALWKKAKEGEPSWESPWGKGRPGWHIECSAMSTKYLGETFDIHGGGLDLVFPHHENEIAQAEGSTGKQFVKYWIHNGFVTINKEKMSKSLKNFFTIREILERFDPAVVRLFLLSTHYRSPVNYSDEDLTAVANKYVTLKEGFDVISAYLKSDVDVRDRADRTGEIKALKDKFTGSMDSDLNTAMAIGVLFETVTLAHSLIKRFSDKHNIEAIKGLMLEMAGILGLPLAATVPPQDISVLMDERSRAKADRDFARSDRIRDDIASRGYILRDTPFAVVLSGPFKRS